MKSWFKLDHVVALTMIVAAISVSWSALRPERRNPPTRSNGPIPDTPLKLDGAHIIGSTTARAALVEFSDYECPFCIRFSQETLPTIHSEYIAPGRALFAFRHLPLTFKHKRAYRAAEATVCASRQGQFWQMHEILFRQLPASTAPDFADLAKQLGLKGREYELCMAGDAKSRVEADLALAKTLSVTGTPTFFVGVVREGNVKVTRRIAGARPLEEFRAALEEAIQSR